MLKLVGCGASPDVGLGSLKWEGGSQNLSSFYFKGKINKFLARNIKRKRLHCELNTPHLNVEREVNINLYLKI